MVDLVGLDISFEAALRAAVAAEYDNDLNTAAQLFDALRSQFPSHVDGHIGYSRILCKLERVPEADAALSKALPQFTDQVEALSFHAKLAEMQGEWDAAADRWAKYVSLYPERPGGFRNCLIALREARRLDEGEALASAALAKFADMEVFWTEWARLATTRGHHEDAVRRWTMLLERFPNYIPAITGLATALVAAGHHDNAAAVLQDGVDRFPEKFDLARQYAQLAAAPRDWPESLRRWNIVLNRFPDQPTGYVQVAEALIHLRRPEEAEALLSTAIDRFGRKPAMLFGLANAARSRRDWQTAIERWEAARQELPDSHVPVVELIQTLIPAKRHAEAEALTKLALVQFADKLPVQIALLTNLAELLMEQHRHDAAAPVIEQLFKLAPANFRATMLLGRLNIVRGNWSEAIDHLTKARELAPHNSQVLAALYQARMGALGEGAEPDSATRMDEPTLNAEHKSLADGFLAFESLGENCEFGLVQRHFGAEPIGLLRWAFIAPAALIAGLAEGFSRLDEPDDLFIDSNTQYYTSRSKAYRMPINTFIPVGSADPALLLTKVRRRLLFMRRKLLEDLKNAEKIFVYRSIPEVSDDCAIEIHRMLQQHGPNRLLVARRADEANPPGTIRCLIDGLAIGYIARHGNEDGKWNIDWDNWLAICRAAPSLLPYRR